MGKQINFWQSKQDVADTVQYIKSLGLSLFTKKGDIIDEFDYDAMSGNLSQFFIGFKDSRLVYLISEHIDSWTSELIEYSCWGITKDNYLQRNRFWIDNHNYKNGNERIYKIYKMLVTYIKKNYCCYEDDISFYLGADFIKKVKSGELIPYESNRIYESMLKYICEKL